MIKVKQEERKNQTRRQILHFSMSVNLLWRQCFEKTGLLISRSLCLRQKSIFIFASVPEVQIKYEEAKPVGI